MLKLIIFFLVLLCVVLLLLIFILEKNAGKIVSVLKEINAGNLNRKINLRSADAQLSELCSELNILSGKLNDAILIKNQIEISQKKLISNISHDLRTPLTSILGYIEAIKNDDSLSADERISYIAIIEAKAKTLYKLVEDFFEMAKLESEDEPLKFSNIDICAKIREVAAEFYQDFVNTEIEPDIVLPDCPIYVRGDETSISRIMHNLLSNALKYGGGGGVIGIGLREEKEKIWIDVWDRGKGIEHSDINLIFERLYTAESSRNEKMRGNGLGLAIVKKLVERMNGEITASSTPWNKTVISFSLTKK